MGKNWVTLGMDMVEKEEDERAAEVEEIKAVSVVMMQESRVENEKRKFAVKPCKALIP